MKTINIIALSTLTLSLSLQDAQALPAAIPSNIETSENAESPIQTSNNFDKLAEAIKNLPSDANVHVEIKPSPEGNKNPFAALYFEAGYSFNDFGKNTTSQPFFNANYYLHNIFESSKNFDFDFNLAYNGLKYSDLAADPQGDNLVRTDSIDLNGSLLWNIFRSTNKSKTQYLSVAVLGTAGFFFIETDGSEHSNGFSPTDDNDFREMKGIGIRLSASVYNESMRPDFLFEMKRVDIEDVSGIDYLVDTRARLPLRDLNLYLFTQGYIGDSGSEGIRYGISYSVDFKKN